ncbi:MAG: hypothetical protein MUF68_02925 [Cyclobacteriaceae bacterium]|jgi:hypothetical protein|nr:hypothetical protein [Cyclobacteriaceae bacterium]
MKKILIVFFTLTFSITIVGILQSCCNPDPLNFIIRSISAKIEKITDVKYSKVYFTDNYITESINHENKLIRYDSIGIVVQVDQESITINAEGSVFNQSLACSPSESYEALADIIIISDKDYSSNFPAGSNLKDLFTMRSNYNLYEVKGDSIQSYLDEMYSSTYLYFLTLNAPPDEEKSHNITIEFVTMNGTRHSAEINSLVIGK